MTQDTRDSFSVAEHPHGFPLPRVHVSLNNHGIMFASTPVIEDARIIYHNIMSGLLLISRVKMWTSWSTISCVSHVPNVDMQRQYNTSEILMGHFKTLDSKEVRIHELSRFHSGHVQVQADHQLLLKLPA